MTYTNLDYLKDFTGNDPQLVKEAVYRYLKKSPALLEQLNHAYKNGEWDEVAFSAHNLYSATQIVGIERIKEALIKIQQLAKERQEDSNGTPDVKPYLDEVNEAIKGSFTELNQYK